MISDEDVGEEEKGSWLGKGDGEVNVAHALVMRSCKYEK